MHFIDVRMRPLGHKLKTNSDIPAISNVAMIINGLYLIGFNYQPMIINYNVLLYIYNQKIYTFNMLIK